ncbi:hypothetical protein [Microbacterium pumilum]|uniref:Uncharacterized protein n=1 Tax=Microbacterium pumilum TaxID=344165 RepID=A0ABP5D707_9MICO
MPELRLGIIGHRAERLGTLIHTDQTLRVELPDEFTDAHLAQMKYDTQFILELIERNPDAIMSIQGAVLRNDFATANEVARSVGLTENNMIDNDGGMWGYIILAAVVIGAYAAFSGSGEEAPPPPPEPPTPPEPTDAGLPGGTG